MTKRLFACALVLLCFVAGKAQGKVVVHIAGLASDKGVCQTCLFNNEASFNGTGQPFRCMAVPVANKKAVAVFDNVPAGTYAVSTFQDTNKNNKLDKNMLGIPKEGYGASKNKLPFAAAPAFKDNEFSVAGNSVINLEIKIRNIGF